MTELADRDVLRLGRTVGTDALPYHSRLSNSVLLRTVAGETTIPERAKVPIKYQ